MLHRRSLFGLVTLATLLAAPPLRAGAQTAPAPAPPSPPPSPPALVVRTETFDAPSIGRPTAYNILLPRGYEASGDQRYPVLYLLHGLTGNYTNWAGMGVARAVEGLDLIVVMPDGGNSWYVNWAESTDGQKNAWDDLVTRDLIGHVDAHYRTIASREGRAINGLSMGGFGALSLGLRHPDLFCAIGSHSGALAFARRAGERLRSGQELPANRRTPSDTPNPRIAIEGFRSQVERTPKGTMFRKAEDADAVDPFQLVLSVPKDKMPQIHLDCGTEDGLVANARDFARVLMEHKIPFTYGEAPGAHNGAYWTKAIATSAVLQAATIRQALARRATEASKDAEAKPEPKPEAKPEPKPDAEGSDKAKAPIRDAENPPKASGAESQPQG